MAILYNRMSKPAYDNFQVSQQRSGTLTLTWELKNGGENPASYFASQTLLIDSDKSGLKTLVLEGAARTVTLSSENISDIKYGNNAKYSFRLVGTPTDSNADKVKSASLKDKHFFVLPRPDVTIVGTPDGMKLTFNDNLPTLLREGETGLGANDLMTGNLVTGAEISLSYVNNGPSLTLMSRQLVRLPVVLTVSAEWCLLATSPRTHQTQLVWLLSMAEITR